MPRVRGNNGIIGVAATAPTASSAGGLFTVHEAGLWKLQGKWPLILGGAASATGGTITLSTGVGVYHTFISSGSFVPTQDLNNCKVLVVGGGSGGGLNNFPGCGGSGGRVTYYDTGINFTSGITYTITVGNGGTAQASGYSAGGNGGTSSIVGTGVSVSATGGTTTGASFTTASGYNNNGTTGSYSGGNAQGGAGAGGNGGANDGGIGSTLGNTLTAGIATAGGTVYGHLVSGTYYYGGGGGNYYSTTYIAGGGGIGGNGAGATVGTANTGGGGGGGGTAAGSAKDGGKGIVIIFYAY